MNVAVQISSLESAITSWTISTSPELVKFSQGQQEILKFFYNPMANKIQGMCRFEKGFEKLLPLFRGLILLGKPASLSLIYDLEKAQVFFTFSQSEKKEVEKFLSDVFELVKKEVRFKQLLEKVIEIKRRHQAEQALLQSSLHTVSWD
jgi:hypothetical protein